MRRIVSFDVETHLIQPGLLTPPLVCGSSAEWANGRIINTKLLTRDDALAEIRRLLLDDNVLICGANIVFDFGVVANEDPTLLPLIFRAYQLGRVWCVLIAQSLNAIFQGHLFKEPNGTPLLNAKGRQTDRYSLDICVRHNLKRTDAKDNDFWRLRYAILQPLPISDYPEDAQQYMRDDAGNTVEVAAYQLGLHPACPLNTDGKLKPFDNLQDMPAQCETDWCLHLGAIWGLRTDATRLEIIERIADKLHDVYVERFMRLGFLRKPREKYLTPEAIALGKVDPDTGKRDTPAVARAVAQSYGATGVCIKCEGTQYVMGHKTVECRGLKVKNRMQGCLGPACAVCSGAGSIQKPTNLIQCETCGASGYGDISMVTPTESGGISSSRDTLMESGNDDLADFGENQQEKVRGTYLPYLRRGVRYPITLEPHVLKETGRTSYSGPIQLFPRGALGVLEEGLWVPTLRECFMARYGRVLGSSDYPGGELCLVAGTRILTDRGYVPIESLVGQPVKVATKYASDSDFSKVPAFHDAVAFASGTKQTVTVTTVDGRIITCTSNHPVLVQKNPPRSDRGIIERYWVPAGKLKPNDKLVTGAVSITETQPQLDAKFYAFGYGFVPALGKAKRFPTCYWTATPDQKRSFLRGLFDADGCVMSKTRTSVSFTSASEELAREVMLALSEFGIVARMTTHYLKKRRRFQTILQVRGAVGLHAVAKHVIFIDKEHRSVKAERLAKLLPGLSVMFAQSAKETCNIKSITKGRRQAVYNLDVPGPRHYIAEGLVVHNCALAQVCLWVVGKSKMADIINESMDPGALHTAFGAKMIGTTPEDLKARIAAKDKSAKLARQNAKAPNFGFGGGMGAVKFVLTNRKEAVGVTEAPNGRKYHGLRFCISIGGAQECGTVMVREWGRKGHERTMAPTCKACIEVVENYLRPLWFDTFPEVKLYHEFVKKEIEFNGSVPAFGPWFATRGTPHRVRSVEHSNNPFPSGANHGFQAYIADIAKDALRRASREAYLDRDSVLYQGQVRIPSFQHDELLSEGLEETAHLWGPRVGQIMHEAYNDWVPDVHIAGIGTALMRFWSKSAEEVYAEDGRLLVWEPKEKK